MKRDATVTWVCETCDAQVKVESAAAHVTCLPGVQFSFSADCPDCGAHHTQTISARFALLLVRGGATCHRLPDHPESGGRGPAFTPDDVLAFHELLADDEALWADLEAAAQ